MLLPFSDSLVVTTKFDVECALLADRHYSRQKVGSNQFLPPGRTITIRDSAGLIVFGWVWQFPEYRDDGQEGYNCAIFRNESARLSSEVILECERIAVGKWGVNRLFTYVNPVRIRHRSRNLERWPAGHCFIKAGWRLAGTMNDGKLLLEKSAADVKAGS